MGIIQPDRFEWLRSNADGLILDVGSAGGHTWIGSDKNVTLLDVDLYAFPNFIRGDAHQLPFKDKSFDTVVLAEVLEHIQDPITVLKEARRVGWKVLVTVPFEPEYGDEYLNIYMDKEKHRKSVEQWVIDNRPTQTIDDEKYPHICHRRFYDLTTLMRHLSVAGLAFKMQMLEYHTDRRLQFFCILAWERDENIQNFTDRYSFIWLHVKGKILNIGSHEGEMFENFTDYDITHLDVNRFKIRNFIHADGLHLPFQDKSFDTVVMSELLEHVADPVATLREARRVAKTRILITVPNEYGWAPDKKPFTHTDHKRCYTRDALAQDISQAGLSAWLHQVDYEGWSFHCAYAFEDFVSIVLPVVNQTAATKKCLETLLKKTPPIYELIIVADQSTEETIGLLLSVYKLGVRLVLNPALQGCAAGFNIGMKLAKGRYIALLSSDTYVTSGWLEALLNLLRRHPEYGWVGATNPQSTFCPVASLVSREALDKVGYWDEALIHGAGFEDDDWLRRMWQAGYKPHGCKDAYVEHPQSQTTIASIRDVKTGFARNQEIFFKKWGEIGTEWNRLPTASLSDE